MDIFTLKEKVFKALHSIDLDKLSLPDIKLYVDIVGSLSIIKDKPDVDAYTALINKIGGVGFGGPKMATVGDLKVEEVDHDGV